MSEAKSMTTPWKNIYEKEYRGMVGPLLYLTSSKRVIVFSVGLCAKFQCSPR